MGKHKRTTATKKKTLDPMPNRIRCTPGALVFGAALFVGLTLQWLRERPQAVSAEAEGQAASMSSRSPLHMHHQSGPATHSSDTRPGALAEIANETPPWQPTPKPTAALRLRSR